MSKRAAKTLRKHRHILQDVLRRLNQGDVDDAAYLLEQEIESMEVDAEAEYEAGQQWYRQNLAEEEQRRQSERIITAPRQQPWFGQAYPGQELSPEQFDELDGDDRLEHLRR